MHYIRPSPRIAVPAKMPAFPCPNASAAPPVLVSLVAVLVFAAALPVELDLVADSVFPVVRVGAAVAAGVLKPNSNRSSREGSRRSNGDHARNQGAAFDGLTWSSKLSYTNCRGSGIDVSTAHRGSPIKVSETYSSMKPFSTHNVSDGSVNESPTDDGPVKTVTPVAGNEQRVTSLSHCTLYVV